ncbi:MAG: hypothetical protein ACNYVW_00450 [Methanosarcinales archaeon]
MSKEAEQYGKDILGYCNRRGMSLTGEIGYLNNIWEELRNSEEKQRARLDRTSAKQAVIWVLLEERNERAKANE